MLNLSKLDEKKLVLFLRGELFSVDM